MRIDLIAPPFSGHLHPLLCMALELAPRHAVRIVGTPAAVAAAARCGLPGCSLLDTGDDAALRALSDPGHAVGHHPLRLHRQLRATLMLMARFRQALGEAWRDAPPGLAIADFTVPAVGSAAAAAGIPWWTSLPSPCVVETPDGPPPYLGGLSPARGAAQRLAHAAGRRATRLFKRGLHGLYRGRMRALGLPRLYRDDGSEAVYSPQRILALGVEALEFPRRWPAAMRFIGPRLPPAGRDAPWATAHPGPRFREGRRHVLVTMGTHLAWSKDALDRQLRALAADVPEVEFHFSDGDAASPRHLQAGNYQRLGHVDYSRWIGRYDLIVHHGGAGILYRCLEAGKPAIVCPRDYDQFDHAARLEAARAARWLRDPAALGAAVRQSLADPAPFAGLPALQAAVRGTVAAHPLCDLVDRHFG